MFIMTFLDLAFPLTQSMEFDVGDTLGIDTNFDEDDTCYESYHTFIKVYDFDMTLEGQLCVFDMTLDAEVTITTSPDVVENISPDPLDTLHVSLSGSSPSPSPKCHNLSHVVWHDMLEGNEIDCIDSLGTFRGYGPSPDPYTLYPWSMRVKIMLATECNLFTDFSKAFNKFKRALAIVSAFLFKCSYLHPSEMHAQVFDKLLQPLMASEWAPWVVR